MRTTRKTTSVLANLTAPSAVDSVDGEPAIAATGETVKVPVRTRLKDEVLSALKRLEGDPYKLQKDGDPYCPGGRNCKFINRGGSRNSITKKQVGLPALSGRVLTKY